MSRFLNTMKKVVKTKTASSHIEAVLIRSPVVLEKLLTYREITKKMTVEAILQKHKRTFQNFVLTKVKKISLLKTYFEKLYFFTRKASKISKSFAN